MDQDEIDRFAATFSEFMEYVVAPARERVGTQSLSEKIKEFVGDDPGSLPVVTETFQGFEHPTVQLAIDQLLARPGVSHELIGAAGGGGREHLSFSELLQSSRVLRMFGLGAPDYVTLPVSPDDEMTCVRFGIYLIADGDTRLAVMMRGGSAMHDRKPMLEVLAASREQALAWLGEVRAQRAASNMLRGQVVSFEPQEHDPMASPIRFHSRPDVQRDDVVLPAGVLERIERQVIGVADYRDRMRGEQRHLKRGVLLYGPPGTGKTHTVRYLTDVGRDATVVLLAGPAIGFVSQACELARQLQPALIVLEDIDLVAQDRSFGRGGQPLLYTILDQMDGLTGDADVCFLLTTNRADLIETALAQRPGRVDLAVEVPLPDDGARARLLRLYGAGIELTDDDVRAIVRETDGVPASFVKELTRRATLLAAARGADTTTADDLQAAVSELLTDQEALTRRLLGARAEDAEVAPPYSDESEEPAAFGWYTAGPGIHAPRTSRLWRRRDT